MVMRKSIFLKKLKAVVNGKAQKRSRWAYVSKYALEGVPMYDSNVMQAKRRLDESARKEHKVSMALSRPWGGLC